jgi:hypothetical protein
MGQYHKPVCPDTKEILDPHQLGVGLKMMEQGFSFAGTRAALIALISRLPGNMPADLGYSTLVGRWAGQRCLVVGDYAEDDDIPDWSGPPVDALYGADSEEPQRHHFDWHKSTEAQEEAYSKGLREWKHMMNAIQGPYTNISEEMSGLLESACSIRFCVTDGWRQYVRVKALAVKGGDEKARYELDFRGRAKERAEYLAYLHRMTGTTSGVRLFWRHRALTRVGRKLGQWCSGMQMRPCGHCASIPIHVLPNVRSLWRSR